ncbi:hypothetical protein HPC49_29880 [Pyxidicoccus fallax]|uniref:Peptidase metallopeptidase domain-containing protein n=1 Tax=Pyxidicoccus fallax TaxID=394095 RepID=A0A848L6N6_9BACT|nr:M57 family metalloprotease [Pyxidicoccus fallax]NMO14314.1 hypothetical protein [Pyxidicoccus fallax]NPC82418.1 hypothetical protein [Pyxidicoccus fallax]
MLDVRSVALLAGVSLLGSACGSAEPELLSEEQVQDVSFEEFLATAYDEPDSDVYVVNGDEAVQGLAGLREYFQKRVGGGGAPGTSEGALTAQCSGGVYNKWSASAARGLTYCVSNTFGANKSRVITAMATATAAWEAAANVNYTYLSQYDGDCTAAQAGVVFDVRPTTNTSYLARAFFPNATRSGRNILISTSALGTIAPYTLAGLLRHELGHTLGFVHEYVRVSTSGCYDSSTGACPLTAYDPASVMHYPQCGGTNTGDFSLSMLDQQGARAYYP